MYVPAIKDVPSKMGLKRYDIGVVRGQQKFVREKIPQRSSPAAFPICTLVSGVLRYGASTIAEDILSNVPVMGGKLHVRQGEGK